MAKLSEGTRRALQNLARDRVREPPLTDEERFVAPTPAARRRYVRFVTQASRLHCGDKPVRFRGDRWKL